MSDKKILLVTGASSEIGTALIRSISHEYNRIWAHYNHSAFEIEMLQREIGEKVIPVQADFLDEDSTRDMIGLISGSGALPGDVVHLPAPKPFNRQFHKQRWENYQKEIDTSLRSIVMILQAFIPEMAKRRHGKIVFMLSAYLLGVPPKYQSPYITVKYGLLGLMRNLSAEYASKGITVNAVSPDMIETKFLSDLPELIIEQSAKNNPLGRNIRVEEVVPAIEYLLSDAANAVTGQNIGVTGGVR